MIPFRQISEIKKDGVDVPVPLRAERFRHFFMPAQKQFDVPAEPVFRQTRPRRLNRFGLNVKRRDLPFRSRKFRKKRGVVPVSHCKIGTYIARF